MSLSTMGALLPRDFLERQPKRWQKSQRKRRVTNFLKKIKVKREKLEARVLRVSRPGMDVLLTEFNVRGFLPARSIGDRVKVDGPNITIGRGKRILSFSEGHAIAIRIKDVDFIRLQVMLELDS